MANRSLVQTAYQTLQTGKGIAGLAHKEISTKLMELLAPEAVPSTSPITKDLLNELRKAIKLLEQVDWEEAEKGIYPKSLLFDAPWMEWLKKYPLVWLDMPSTWKRRSNRTIRDLPKGINREKYPDYYLQNFHHQTDGYLSEHSAELYDIQVEILFNGTGDSMRRRILSPLKKGLENFKERKASDLKVLDVATGTGRTLQQIRSALPEVDLYGIDLSGAYLKQASKYLSSRHGEIVQLVRGNAENMSFKDETFQAISCVFLFHELPRDARKKVINECFRVLEPGGTLVLADSIQIEDSPKFITVMENFHRVFHEPFYSDYVKDDISSKLNEVGFESISSENFFMTKVWRAIKPKS